MSTTADRLVEQYLKRLRTELRDLPRARRHEVVDDIAAHIAEARAELEIENEAAVRTLLERIGDPAEIAAEEHARSGAAPARTREVAAIVLLLLGGFVFVGWIVGVILLWASNAWTKRDKLIGTLVVPGGLALSLFVFTFVGFASGSSAVCQSPAVEVPPPPAHAAPRSAVPPLKHIVKTRQATRSVTCSGGSGVSAWMILGIFGLIAVVLAPFATTVYLAKRMETRAPVAV